ncbi:NACHT domain-containing protein [Actinokineospora sp. NPDC004072]
MRTDDPAGDGNDLDRFLHAVDVPLPPWLKLVLLGLIVVGAVAAGLKLLGPPVRSAAALLRRWWQRRSQDQRRAARRAGFATHVEGQMRHMGVKEEWRDDQYAELEAEIEVRRPRRRSLWGRRAGEPDIRRVPSLSAALGAVSDKLVILEGDPGSGKSVALRHLTEQLALRVVRHPSEDEPIPLYVNLKELKPTGAVTADDVRELVIASLNRGRDRKVDRYLADEFDRGLAEGTWLFLFDSFDEIPAILGATEADPVIEAYSDAIHDFLHGMNACRGIVASREFRGPPRKYAWPKFQIMPLSWARKVELVEKADLTAAQEAELLDGLRGASAEIYAMSDNPMFLGLLCEHIREGREFPRNAHVVIESYVQERFERDARRIRDIFAVEPAFVRAVAEELAFRIADHDTLGLTVGRPEVVALLADRFAAAEDELAAAVDALAYTKLARSDEADRAVTFAHRRLQEYFATCVVLREPDRVAPERLVADGRWRETAVTILQTQTGSGAAAVHRAAGERLVEPAGDEWEPGQYHLLRVLADGGGSRKYPAELPELAGRVDAVLDAAWRGENLRDRKWALEVCPAATPAAALRYVSAAFQGESQWLREEAFSQTARLPEVSAGIEAEIRQTLIDLSARGELRRSRRSIRAQVSRLSNPVELLRAIRLLLAVPVIDLAFGLLVCAMGFALTGQAASAVVLLGVWLVTGLFLRAGATHPAVRNRVFGGLPLIGGTPSESQLLRTLVLLSGGIARLMYVLMFVAGWDAIVGTVLSGRRWQDFIPIAAVVVAATLWVVGALFGVRGGEHLRVVRWPLLITLPVRHMARAVRRFDRATFLRVLGKVLGVVLLLAAAITLLATALFVWLGLSLRELVIGVGALATAGALAVLVTSRRDLQRARVALAEDVVTHDWLAGKLAALRGPSAVVALLENLRLAKPKPTWDPAALDLLLGVGRAVAAARRAAPKPFVYLTASEAAFAADWAARGVRHRGGLAKYDSAAVLDEIARIHDETTSRSAR